MKHHYIIFIFVFLFLAVNSVVQILAQDLKPHALEVIVPGIMPKILDKTEIKDTRTYKELLDSDVFDPPLLPNEKDPNKRQDKEFLKKVVKKICQNPNTKLVQAHKDANVPTVLEVCNKLILEPFGITVEKEEDHEGNITGWKPPVQEVWEKFEKEVDKATLPKLELKPDWFDMIRKAAQKIKSFDDAKVQPFDDAKVQLEDTKYLETVKKHKKTEGTYSDDIDKLSKLLHDYRYALSP
jgi:hypothetical protein